MSRNSFQMKRAILFFAGMMVGLLPSMAAADDILLVGGGSWWRTLPVARSTGRSGIFSVTNEWVGDFAQWASTPGVTRLSGDFDGDGAIDVALTGVPGWASIPVAFSRGGGRFDVTNVTDDESRQFAQWAAEGEPGKGIVTGDFNGDRRTDLMLIGKLWLERVMVAYSNGNGTFETKDAPDGFIDTRVDGLGRWVNAGGTPITGDFNGDSYDDVAVLGLQSFFSDSGTFPVAFSNGDDTFTLTGAGCLVSAGGESCPRGMAPMALFTFLAAQPRVEKLTGDFNGDGLADIALLDRRHWQSFQLRVAFSTSFVGNFEYPTDWAANAGAAVTGDFNGDARTDVVLVGGKGWQSAPVLFSNGDGTFVVANEWIEGWFADSAAYDGATVLTGDFDGDRRTDLALLGPNWWTTIPVAFSNGNGTFSVTNESPRVANTVDYEYFVQWANEAPDVSPFVGRTFVCGLACAPSPIFLPGTPLFR